MNYSDLLNMTSIVSREKEVSRDTVFDILENGLARCLSSQYPLYEGIFVTIDRNDGNLSVYGYEKGGHISQGNSGEKSDNCREPVKLPEPVMTRSCYHSMKNFFLDKVKLVGDQNIYENLKDSEGSLVSGYVVRSSVYYYYVNIGRTEATLNKKDALPLDDLKDGSKVMCLLKSVILDDRGLFVRLSRKDNLFLIKLLVKEIAEIQSGNIEIISIARDIGSYTKVSVRSNSRDIIDPLGCCLGARGARIRAVIDELRGEKIEIVVYRSDIAEYIASAINRSCIKKIVLYDASLEVDVVVAKSKLPFVLGRGGQNIRLASRLTGKKIKVITDEEDAVRTKQEELSFLQELQSISGVSEDLAKKFVQYGMKQLSDFLVEDKNDLLMIEGINDSLLSSIREFIVKAEEDQRIESFYKGKDHFLEREKVLLLLKKGICSIEDLAEMSSFEIKDMDLSSSIGSDKEVEELIKRSRLELGWFS